jgi:Leucine-rich repeat (LRR) protein
LEFKEILLLTRCKKWKIYITHLKSNDITQKIIKQEKYRKLKYLDISYNRYITNINHLRKLEILEADNCKLGNEGISELKNIKLLYIDYNENNENITDINHLQKLEILDASGSNCKLGNEGISELTNIKRLDISGNKNITDINHLQKLEILKATRFNCCLLF